MLRIWILLFSAILLFAGQASADPGLLDSLVPDNVFNILVQIGDGDQTDMREFQRRANGEVCDLSRPDRPCGYDLSAMAEAVGRIGVLTALRNNPPSIETNTWDNQATPILFAAVIWEHDPMHDRSHRWFVIAYPYGENGLAVIKRWDSLVHFSWLVVRFDEVEFAMQALNP